MHRSVFHSIKFSTINVFYYSFKFCEHLGPQRLKSCKSGPYVAQEPIEGGGVGRRVGGGVDGIVGDCGRGSRGGAGLEAAPGDGRGLAQTHLHLGRQQLPLARRRVHLSEQLNAELVLLCA